VSEEREFRVNTEFVELAVEVPVGWMEALTLVGGLTPRVRILPRVTSSTATSIITSDLGLSMS
jgi:hypothetical protein